MHRCRLLFGLMALIALHAAPGAAAAQTAADSAAIHAAALDYVDGWYTGDGERMRRALHSELAKRISTRDDAGRWTLDQMTADELAGAAARGGGSHTPEADRQRDVRILDVYGNAASVRATMSGWVDYMHLAKVDGRWVIVNVLWELKPRP
jgi:hypothetical protein